MLFKNCYFLRGWLIEGGKNLSTNPKQQETKKTNWIIVFAVILIAFLGAFIGLEMIVTFGLAPNTAIIGIICAMLLARVPVSIFQQFRSSHVQNLLQMSVNCATFGAANALLVPIGIPFLMGRNDLIYPMLIGASFAMIVDALMIYHFFGTQLFPAEENWPKGFAMAKTIEVGVDGGKPLLLLGLGFVSGWIGALFHIPLSAIGMAFLSKILPMTMLAIGNILGGSIKHWWQIDLHALYLPHGVMIGAGLVILVQTLKLFLNRKHVPKKGVHQNEMSTRLFKFMALFFVLSLTVLLIAGLFRSMSIHQLILFILLTVLMQFFQRLLVGSTVMLTGFLPAFSLALVFLVIGIMLNLPIQVLAIFAGYTAATGPILACFGDALKTGDLLRGEGKSIEVERNEKTQQLLMVGLTLLVIILVVFISYPYYFAQNRVPPVDHVFLATLKAGSSFEMMNPWLIGGMIVGMVLQWSKGVGILFATGLLLNNPILGGMILMGVLLQSLLKNRVKSSTVAVLSAGIISGDVMGRLSNIIR